MKQEEKTKEQAEGLAIDPAELKLPLRPTLTVDWKLYEPLLESAELTDDQKREFIETMWSLVVAFVDLGFDVHPVQQACGQNPEIPQGDNMLVIQSHPSSGYRYVSARGRRKKGGTKGETP